MTKLGKFEFLRVQEEGAVVSVTMSRPPVNAVNQAMYREIRDLFGGVGEAYPDAAVVILGSEGKHFCGGNDLDEFATLDPDNSPERMREVRRAFWAIYDCPVPVIAAVQGSALGTGLAIAASCDFVVAAAGAKLGLPEVAVGVMGGARHLARLVPAPLQRWMFFSADPVPVEQLTGIGAIVAVVEADSLAERARWHAERIARHSPVALRVGKRSLNAIEDMDLKAGYAYEQRLTTELCGHPDSKEAMQAFLERRAPRYHR